MPLTFGMLPRLRSNIDIGETDAIASPEWFGERQQPYRRVELDTIFDILAAVA